MILKNALSLSHDYILQAVSVGDTVIDATCGNGHDTLFLSTLVGKDGHVYAFDIQPRAIDHTRERLTENIPFENTALICDGHENMEKYVSEKISAAMFNLGYLPGADHSISTKKDTSIAAVCAACRLLKSSGLITLCVYSGGDTGFEEKNAILNFCKTLDPKIFTVAIHDFINQPNHPPMLVCIEKK